MAAAGAQGADALKAAPPADPASMFNSTHRALTINF